MSITNCNTCGRPASEPYRRYGNDGRIIEGCIDNFHAGHLVPCSASEHWHNRKEAKILRQTAKTRLK